MQPLLQRQGDSWPIGKSPVNIDILNSYLRDYPDQIMATQLLNGFISGFPIHYGGPRIPQYARNLKSAYDWPDIVSAKIQNEISHGRVAGPFTQPPFRNFRVSPIGLVEKKGKNDYRLIHHLSYPNGESVNDFIPHELCSVQYTHFDEAVEMVRSLGRHSLLSKVDIQSAFRLLPVSPSDFELLGMKHNGMYYFDMCLPFGAAISCSTFETFSTFLEWCIKEKSKSKNIKHYLDDFLFGGKTKPDCDRILQFFFNICNDLGVPLAIEKTVYPTTVLVFLGLELDSDNMVVRIPLSKLIELREKIRKMLSKTKTTLLEIQSLIGSLSFACNAIPFGRPFIRRLIDGISGKALGKHHHLRVNLAIREDLEVWSSFLSEHNGVSIIHDREWLINHDIQLFTDSSGKGFGIFLNGSWCYGAWPNSWVSRDITVLEMFPIVVSVFLWSAQLKDKKILYRCDNMSVCHIVNALSSKSKDMMVLVRLFVLQCLKFSIYFRCEHIPGIYNTITDALSRLDFQRFRRLAQGADALPMPVPENLWQVFE